MKPQFLFRVRTKKSLYHYEMELKYADPAETFIIESLQSIIEGLKSGKWIECPDCNGHGGACWSCKEWGFVDSKTKLRYEKRN